MREFKRFIFIDGVGYIHYSDGFCEEYGSCGAGPKPIYAQGRTVLFGSADTNVVWEFTAPDGWQPGDQETLIEHLAADYASAAMYGNGPTVITQDAAFYGDGVHQLADVLTRLLGGYTISAIVGLKSGGVMLEIRGRYLHKLVSANYDDTPVVYDTLPAVFDLCAATIDPPVVHFEDWRIEPDGLYYEK